MPSVCDQMATFVFQCRGRGVTYKGSVHVQIQYSVNGEQGPPILKQIGQIPIMVKVC